MSEASTDTSTENPAMDKAIKDGWSGQDKWRGKPEDWIDYTEFNLRGELMGRIHEQSGVISHLTSKVEDRDKALEDVKEIHKTISKREYKRAMDDLKAQKKEALKDEEFEAVVDIDEEMNTLRSMDPSKQEEVTQPDAATPQVPQEIVSWLSKPEQSWYHTDQTMRDMSEGIADGIQKRSPNISVLDLIAEVDREMRATVPHKFQARGGEVDEGGEYDNTPTRGGSSKRTYATLTADEKASCDRFVRLDLMSRDDYISSIVELEES
jgi:hypothetical protein